MGSTQLESRLSNNKTTLVLNSDALDSCNWISGPPRDQGRLAFIPSKHCVICWGFLKGSEQRYDKLLVSVVEAISAEQAWRIEDLIRATPTVQLKCGDEVVSLDANRDTCVLGPRSYVTAQPSGSLPEVGGGRLCRGWGSEVQCCVMVAENRLLVDASRLHCRMRSRQRVAL